MKVLVWSLIAFSLLAAAVIFLLRAKRSRRADSRPVQPGPSSAAPPNPPETAAAPIDKNVQFTVYRPATIVPEKWYPLLAFAHLSERRADAPPQEPDPIQQVHQQAAQTLGEQSAKYEPAKLDRAYSVPRKGALTFVPLIEGCEFNPPTQSILWQKDVHKVEFDMKASQAVDGRAVEGRMTVYLGAIILAEVPLRINVDSRYSQESEQAIEEHADPYRKIFASYSHRDEEIVDEFENMIESLGDEYLRDVRTLRSGEVWSEQLEQMIRDANIFQLFWSSNSMISAFVKQEWEYALSLNRANFIRPVYWEKQFPEKKPDLPPETLRRLHFYRLPVEEETRSALIPGETDKLSLVVDKVKPVPQPDPAPIKLTRRIPLTTITKAALAVLLVGVLLPIATIQYFRVGPGSNTNTNTNAGPTSAPALDVKVHPITISTNVQASNIRAYRGQSGSYELIITNRDAGPITDVTVREELPPDLGFVSSEPLPLLPVNNQLGEWRVSEIQKGEDFKIKISVRLMRNVDTQEELKTQQTITFKDAQGDQHTIRSQQTPLQRLLNE